MLHGAAVARNPVDRFWPKVDKNGPVPAHRPDLGPCWLWTASTVKDGYGQFHSGGKESRTVKAHVYAYTLLVGPVPEGLQLDHLCRVRRCVNPQHLEAVTCKVNVMRGSTLAAENAAKTHCIRDHLLSGENLYVDKRGSRVCITCIREHQRVWRANNLERRRAQDREAKRRKRDRDRAA